jgi:hypothetical protein
MENVDSALRQSRKTVRIVTDLPVLVQTQTTLTRKGRNKPMTVLLGRLEITLSLTDSGEPVIKIAEPP